MSRIRSFLIPGTPLLVLLGAVALSACGGGGATAAQAPVYGGGAGTATAARSRPQNRLRLGLARERRSGPRAVPWARSWSTSRGGRFICSRPMWAPGARAPVRARARGRPCASSVSLLLVAGSPARRSGPRRRSTEAFRSPTTVILCICTLETLSPGTLPAKALLSSARLGSYFLRREIGSSSQH